MAIQDYVTRDEIKQGLPDSSWGSDYDAGLDVLAARASRAIDMHLKRKPGAFYVNADVTLYFDGSGNSQLWIEELAAAPTSVQVAETGVLTTLTSWASTDYVLWPYNALDYGTPYLRLDVDLMSGTKSLWYGYRKAVKIVGKFGFSTTVPGEIKEAAIIQAVRWFKRGQQAFADVGAVEALGQLKYVQRLDPDVAGILEGAKFGRMTI